MALQLEELNPKNFLSKKGTYVAKPILSIRSDNKFVLSKKGIDLLEAGEKTKLSVYFDKKDTAIYIGFTDTGFEMRPSKDKGVANLVFWNKPLKDKIFDYVKYGGKSVRFYIKPEKVLYNKIPVYELDLSLTK